MLQKMYTPFRFTVILGLVLVLAFSAIAARTSQTKNTRENATQRASTSDNTLDFAYDFGLDYYDFAYEIGLDYYKSGDVTIELDSHGKSTAGEIELIANAISLKIDTDSVTSYMAEQNWSTVKITAELFGFSDGSLLFVFGPSGAHFSPSLEIILEKGYGGDGVILMDEYGELIESTRQKQKRTTFFYIQHFSRYSYDLYNY